jgi:hypothetical protein
MIDFTEQVAKQPAFDITPEWLAQAELVVVRRTPSGSVARTIEIPGVEVVAAPAPAKVPGF